MLSSYKCQYFKIYELVPKIYFEEDPEAMLWLQFDDRLLRTLDMIRKKYGPIIVNNWKRGGPFQYRGLRPPDCSAGVKYSQHKHGRACDFHSPSIEVEELRQEIIKNPWNEEFKYITCIEDKVNWVHIDVRNHDKVKSGLLIVNP